MWYHLYAWGVPLTVAGALWLVGKYGESELWCYIPDSDRFFMLTFLYLPLIIVCLGTAAFFSVFLSFFDMIFALTKHSTFSPNTDRHRSDVLPHTENGRHGGHLPVVPLLSHCAHHCLGPRPGQSGADAGRAVVAPVLALPLAGLLLSPPGLTFASLYCAFFQGWVFQKFY